MIIIMIIIMIVIEIADFDEDLASKPAVQERPVTGKQSWEEVVYLGGDWTPKVITLVENGTPRNG